MNVNSSKTGFRYPNIIQNMEQLYVGVKIKNPTTDNQMIGFKM